jgi:hypothetical protein
MTLHFAYGSNMSRSLMLARCPGASAIDTVALAGWQFVIAAEGFASLLPRPGSRVYGVLWRLTVRDLAAINAYENVQSGLYRSRRLLVGRSPATPALVYIARRQGAGIPRPGYINLILEAARDWQLPKPYIRAIARWAPSRWPGARARDIGEPR